MHECLGRAVGQVLICEIVRQVLRLDGVGAASAIKYQGGAPEQWQLKWAA